MKNVRTSLIAAALLAGASLAAQAADLLDDVKARGTLRIAVEGTYPPFNYKDEKGQLTGFDVEIATAIAGKLGVKPEFTTTEWSGILAGLQAGKYDVIVNQVAATDERRKTFDFSTAYVMSYPQLIIRANETRQLLTPADLKGKKIGVGQGSNFAEQAKGFEGVEVRTYPGATEYLQDLATGRIDAALNDSLLIPYLKQKTKLPVKAGAAIGQAATNAIPFRKNSPKFKAAIDKALSDLMADGTYAKISTKWFERDVSKPIENK
ncbi:transporter substrate-binding domain-containing protein [Roseateles chitosanitabidus]|jgi:cystine transport system substrate-binding protein|uniref:transporter substrate-binding domain-containing protein n=1 Tax=Roseateles chitosanitabidus TaxID=65048 RepID=UPI00082C3553|nr:transporter substrate-binding domain-containing protein [Roseateles chitosanitabidus]MBO9686124.1 transporter substrate-binding domain-containing protein [Roseateles chitosanitabidus]